MPEATEKAFEFVSVGPQEVVGYAAGIALKEAIGDGVITDAQAKAIVNRTIELTNAMFDRKFVNPDPARDGYWVIADKPDERAPEEIKKAAEAAHNSVLEIGG